MFTELSILMLVQWAQLNEITDNVINWVMESNSSKVTTPKLPRVC
jgi:hypothetical protein